MCARLAATYVLFATTAVWPQAPAGIVWTAGEALLLRQGSELPVRLEPGDLLFPGDSIDVRHGPVTLAHCAAHQEILIAGTATVRMSAGEAQVSSGNSQRQPLPQCFLPEASRKSLETVRFFGARTRALLSATPPALAAPPPSIPELKSVDSAQPEPRQTLARAVILEKNGQFEGARQEYEKLSRQMPAVDWPRKLVHEQEERIGRQQLLLAQQQAVAAAAAGEKPKGRTFALLVGISEYARLRREEQLQFAAADAQSMASFFRSPRGGAVPPEDTHLLTDRNATSAALRNAIGGTIREQATKQDTVFIFIAAHGIFDQRGAYIVTYDTDPEDLAATAVPMAELQRLIEEEFSHVGRVFLFVDICRAGTIGSIAGNKIHSAVEALLRLQATDLFVLLSSGPRQYSFESERFGGGHGAFSYFLLRGLNGDADADKDGRVRVGELAEYVRSSVRQATRGKQTPRESGTMDTETVLVDGLDKPGVDLPGWTPIETGSQQARRSAERRVQDEIKVSFTSLTAPEQQTLTEFEEALSQARVLPETPGSAYSVWSRYRQDSREDNRVSRFLENRLRVALQDRGQSVLLRYLQGDAITQKRQDFDSGELFFNATLQLDPKAPALESRALFCRARRLIFENRSAEAVPILERAARIDPTGAYVFNALGIAYLELSRFPLARLAFRDAARLSPRWIYPRHNLALTNAQMGDYREAEEAYLEARKLSPRAFFLAYNLGMLYQQMNRSKDAERLLGESATLDPTRPEALNGLGLVAAGAGKLSRAEDLYRKALTLEAKFPPARHNLALLLWSQSKRRTDAIPIWRQLVSDQPTLTAARAALAEALQALGDLPAALQQYEQMLAERPTSLSARLALAECYVRSGEASKAESLLAAAAAHPALEEKLADVHAASGRADRARLGYQALLARITDSGVRKRLQTKIKGLLHAAPSGS